MPTFKKFFYKQSEAVDQKQVYSVVPTDVYHVGYVLTYRVGEQPGREVLYFASRKQQTAATFACMQRHKNCVVQSVLYL